MFYPVPDASGGSFQSSVLASPLSCHSAIRSAMVRSLLLDEGTVINNMPTDTLMAKTIKANLKTSFKVEEPVSQTSSDHPLGFSSLFRSKKRLVHEYPFQSKLSFGLQWHLSFSRRSSPVGQCVNGTW